MEISDVKGTVILNNGIKMPYLGLGVFQAKDGKEVIHTIQHAFAHGYRLIDTAALYGNEKGVGEAVRRSNLHRSEVFITSKVWNSDQGYEKTLKVFDNTMKRLKLDTLDLYLIHWPVQSRYKDTWKALEQLYRGKTGAGHWREQFYGTPPRRPEKGCRNPSHGQPGGISPLPGTTGPAGLL